MSKVKILIVEDDPSYALELQMLVFELNYQVVATVDNAKDAFTVIAKVKPDLILMDIQIKGDLDGIEIAEKLQDENIGIIFITSINDKDVFNKAKKTNSFGFLVKPFNELTLESAIETALMLLHPNKNTDDIINLASEQEWKNDLILNECVFIKKKSRLEKVAFKKIDFIQADGNYCYINSEKRKYALKLSLRKIIERLPEHFFYRVNKSHIINLENIESVELSENIILVGAHKILIGKPYRSGLLKKLKTIV